ncbi:MAG: hypothetical protein M1399_08940 [Actinobacteria bacterium]|nr:hypothetical protein [Actinomycetota bacterium]
MPKNDQAVEVVGHIVVGAVVTGLSHALVPVRNWFDYVVRTLVMAFLSALVRAYL